MKRILAVPVLLLLVLLTVSILSACPSTGGNGATLRKNLLIVTIDTARTDRIGCYGYQHSSTPNIDALAGKGMIFERAFAQTPMTLPSHTNIFLGTTPPYHGVHENANFIVDEKYLTLAEHLKENGYSTGAFIGSYALDSRFGLAQGFDVYDDTYDRMSSQKYAYGERKAEEVVTGAMAWLEKQNGPWFLWVHCFDPHYPYEPPEPFRSQYKEQPYDGEVSYVDFALGKLFSRLREKGGVDDTVIVITSDHGESLGQHGEETHGFLAYNTTLWVPLIILSPGMPAKRIDQTVTHIDLFPTVCDLLGIEKTASLQGMSLLPAMKRGKLPKRKIYFESLYPYYVRGWAPIRGYLDDSKKYVEAPLPELFNLKRDFDEQHNLVEDTNLASYRRELAGIIERLANPEGETGRAKIDRESRRRLESLGYISGPVVRPKKTYTSRDDVKVLLPYYNKSIDAMDLFDEGKAGEAVRMLKEVITEREDVDIAYSKLADIYRYQGRIGDALTVLKQGLEVLPDSYEIFSKYINDLVDAGLFQEVINSVSGTQLFQMDYDPEIWNYLGTAQSRLGQYSEADKAFEKALSLDPKYADVYFNIGLSCLALFLKEKDQSVFERSVRNFEKAIELDPRLTAAYNGLANAYAGVNDLEKAVSYWNRALEIRPDNPECLYNLGYTLSKLGRRAEALEHLNSFHRLFYDRLSPKERTDLDNLISSLKKRD
ncbi:MAG: sulfatase-like hydrolase/transferase [Candidatus Aminicenantes bacterium]|nr:sulfatase-like hydrolase/transferase [Candidatus Aminicenantes bacterium]